MKSIIISLLFSISIWAQDCSPYHKVTNWESNDDVEFTVAWVSCFHASGMALSTDWNNMSMGFHIMGEGHDNSAYTFLVININLLKELSYLQVLYID